MSEQKKQTVQTLKVADSEGTASLNYVTDIVAGRLHDYTNPQALHCEIHVFNPSILITAHHLRPGLITLEATTEIFVIGEYAYGGNYDNHILYNHGTLEVAFDEHERHFDVTIHIDARGKNHALDSKVKGTINVKLMKRVKQ